MCVGVVLCMYVYVLYSRYLSHYLSFVICIVHGFILDGLDFSGIHIRLYIHILYAFSLLTCKFVKLVNSVFPLTSASKIGRTKLFLPLSSSDLILFLKVSQIKRVKLGYSEVFFGSVCTTYLYLNQGFTE